MTVTENALSAGLKNRHVTMISIAASASST